MATNYADASMYKSKFWNNKPITKFDEKIYGLSKTNEDITRYKKTDYTVLPDGYTWTLISICDNEKMDLICNFLTENYRRGTDSSYIIKYNIDMIQWELNNTGYFLSVNDSTSKIIGIIGMTYRTVQIYSSKHTITEPVYLCCEKEYRKTGIAKVLIDETIRQSMIFGIDKGVFCNNRIVSKPIITLRQYSRPLNYKKLRENDFIEICGVDEDVVHNKTKINLKPNKRYIVAEKTEQNINIVYEMYCKYMESFTFHVVLTKKDIETYMFNEKYVKTVLIMDENGLPVDFVSYNFYDIINTNKNDDNIIKVANLLMYSSNNIRVDLIFINILKQISYDKIELLYIMDIMHNNEIILSNVKNADEDTDDEEENASYDMNIVKTGKKLFINLFNIKCESFKQNMVSWLSF